jgi:hypothetical protein
MNSRRRHLIVTGMATSQARTAMANRVCTFSFRPWEHTGLTRLDDPVERLEYQLLVSGKSFGV